MANFIYNEAKRALAQGEIDLVNDDIRVLLVMTNTTCDTEDDKDTFAGFTTIDEMDGANYTTLGIALSNQVVNEDTGNDRAEFDSSDTPTWSSLGAGTRQVQAMIVYKYQTSLNASEPIAYIDTGGFPFTANGGDVVINFNAEGILQVA